MTESVAQSVTSWNCHRVNTALDSIFNHEQEESLHTKKLTPLLYQIVQEKQCESRPKILTLAGIIYYNEGQYIKAKEVLEEADSIFLAQGCASNICVFTKLILGLVEKKTPNTERAFALFKQAGKLSQKQNFFSGQIQSLINHALIYNETGQLDEAKEYLNKAKLLVGSCESKDITGYVYMNLGHSYIQEENYEEAKKNFAEAERIWAENNFQKGMYFLENNYATMASLQGKPGKYEEHLRKAALLMEQDSIISNSLSYLRLGNLFVSQDRNEEALIFLEKAIKLDDGHRGKEFLDLATKLIAIYGAKNDADKIEKVSNRIQEIYQLKFNNITKQDVKWKKKDFVLETKIIENEELKKTQERIARKVRIRNLLLTMLLALMLLSLFLFRSWSNERKIKEQLRLEKLRSEISRDLHDDVGTMLAGISFQAQLLEMEDTATQKITINNIVSGSKQAISKMRDLVWAIDSRNSSSLDLEMRMKDYLSELVEQNDKSYTIHLDLPRASTFNAQFKYELFTIFKESVYNIIKHSDATAFDIKLSQGKDELLLSISDNGTEKPIKKSGQGLRNMKERTESQGGTYRFYYDEGYKTEAVFPLMR